MHHRDTHTHTHTHTREKPKSEKQKNRRKKTHTHTHTITRKQTNAFSVREPTTTSSQAGPHSQSPALERQSQSIGSCKIFPMLHTDAHTLHTLHTLKDFFVPPPTTQPTHLPRYTLITCVCVCVCVYLRKINLLYTRVCRLGGGGV